MTDYNLSFSLFFRETEDLTLKNGDSNQVYMIVTAKKC